MSGFNHTAGVLFTTGECQLYYEERGRDDKAVLLFLHGGMGSMESFNSILPLFEDQFRCIGLDTRGHGRSTLGNKKLTYAQIADDSSALLQHLSLDSCHVIGFSDGGIAALRLAGTSNAVRSLVTIGSSWTKSDVEAIAPMLGELTEEAARTIFADEIQRYEQIQPEADLKRLLSVTRELWLDMSESGHPDDLVENITAPVLAIRGEDDFMVSQESHLALKKRLQKGAMAVVPFAAHDLLSEAPQLLGALLQRFYQS